MYRSTRAKRDAANVFVGVLGAWLLGLSLSLGRWRALILNLRLNIRLSINLARKFSFRLSFGANLSLRLRLRLSLITLDC